MHTHPDNALISSKSLLGQEAPSSSSGGGRGVLLCENRENIPKTPEMERVRAADRERGTAGNSTMVKIAWPCEGFNCHLTCFQVTLWGRRRAGRSKVQRLKSQRVSASPGKCHSPHPPELSNAEMSPTRETRTGLTVTH